MKKIIFLIIALSIVIVILFIQSNKKTIVMKKADTIIEEPIFKEKIILPDMVQHSLSQKKPIVNKPFKAVIKSEITEKNIQEKKRENIVLNITKNIHPKILEEMKQLPNCLKQAKTKDSALNCNTRLHDLHRKMSIVMGEFEGDGNNTIPDFVWNDETRQNMIEAIEHDIPLVYELQACIELAKDSADLEECLNPK